MEPSLCVLKPSTMNLQDLDCDVLELGFRTFKSPAAVGCLRRLRRFILDHQVDVVQTFFQDPTLLGWLASIRTPVRARIASFRDMGFWRTPAKVAQLRLAYPNFDGFIANSPAVAQRMSRDWIAFRSRGSRSSRTALRPTARRSIRRSGRWWASWPTSIVRSNASICFWKRRGCIVNAAGRVEFVVIGEGPSAPGA